MSNNLIADFNQACENLKLPNTDILLLEAGKIHSLSIADNQLHAVFNLFLPYNDETALSAAIDQALQQHFSAQGGQAFSGTVIKIQTQIKTHSCANAGNALPGIKNIIAVASGKGGVGKSTTTINLALALQQQGARVGILDADIFGPSQSMLAGVAPNTRPDVKEQKFFVPIEAHGIQFMSMGFLVDEQTPMVWRGPKASGALQQMLTQTAWQDLDYLFVDMPPGTGDIQLTLSQSCPLTAAIIVTTPQDIALLDAIKGIEMFRKVNVPILGIIENMSMHICSACGHEEAIFGHGGGERVAETYQTPLLAQLPLDKQIREQADSGKPTVASEPEGRLSQLYRQAAWQALLELNKLPQNSAIPNVVSIS